MTSLTRELDDRHSPVSRWMREHFPHHRQIQKDIRSHAGVTRIRPPAGIALGTQGAAIEWWLRFLIDPAPSLLLPLQGIHRVPKAPFRTACMKLATALRLNLDAGAGNHCMFTPADYRDKPDHWWARVSYSMALMVELFRTNDYQRSRLLTLPAGSNDNDVLHLITDDEIADLIAMRDLAMTQLLPRLSPGPVVSGPTFTGSADLAGDADLIVNGTLLEVKATQGGRPRTDGTRILSLDHQDIHQMLGYALMDYHDQHELNTIAVYAPRFGYFRSWPINEYLYRLAGRHTNLTDTRNQFRNLLQQDLPVYREKKLATTT